MKLTSLLAALLFVATANGQLPTAANVLPSVKVTPKAAGDTLLVQCDFNTTTVTGGITDSAGTAYSAVGGVNSSAFGGFSQIVSLSAPLASGAAVTVNCPANSAGGEVYAVDLPGAFSVDTFIQTNGANSPASGTLPTSAADTVIGFCVTGTCSPTSGWTSLSTFNRNLVASQVGTGNNTASFTTNAPWILTLVAVKPASSTPPPPPPPPPAPPPPAGTAIPSFQCTPSFLPVTFSTFVPSGAKGVTFSILNSDPTTNLVITAVTPPTGFAVDPVALPLTIVPGDSQTFTIRFLPTAAGTFRGNVTFTANVAGGSFLMGVSGIAQ